MKMPSPVGGEIRDGEKGEELPFSADPWKKAP